MTSGDGHEAWKSGWGTDVPLSACEHGRLAEDGLGPFRRAFRRRHPGDDRLTAALDADDQVRGSTRDLGQLHRSVTELGEMLIEPPLEGDGIDRRQVSGCVALGHRSIVPRRGRCRATSVTGAVARGTCCSRGRRRAGCAG